MWKESSEDIQPLRTGLTTGSCATACSVACAELLLAEKKLDIASITLPKGQTVELTLSECVVTAEGAFASTIKDAGDDPDVTHGALVFVNLMLTEEPGINFFAGMGVGTVTKEGLLLGVGEPAINPVPRAMMSEHLEALALRYAYKGGFNVSVGVEQGDMLAQKTMNPRLGIIGGLSILGTTGIVRPFSCSAWIASIHQGIDVAKANGIKHIAATTGNASELAIKTHYALEDQALIEMGDFVGAVLKHVKKNPIEKLTISGGFGKITKLANSHMDLNSRVSKIDFSHIAEAAKEAGANKVLQKKILTANTSIEALKLCEKDGIDLAAVICRQALAFAQSKLPASVEVEVWAINRHGDFVGSALDGREDKR
ncbi:MAG: cobalt-precorrin-5B (C(1))-methyltransferase [Pseudomonadales bacterium]|nr:cobalt-precorrin-5B (C(1))-methyltransferase [Pseudomonadales bacterium]